MSSFRTLSRGINRAPSLRPVRSQPDHPIGAAQLFAGDPGWRWLLMDSNIAHSAAHFGQLLAVINPAHILRDEYEAAWAIKSDAVTGAAGNHFGLGTLGGGDAGNTVAIFNYTNSARSLSQNGGDSWTETVLPFLLSANKVGYVAPSALAATYAGSVYFWLSASPFTARSEIHTLLTGGVMDWDHDSVNNVLIAIAWESYSTQISRSNNGGATWTTTGVSDPVAGTQKVAICCTGTHWLVATSANIYRATVADPTVWTALNPTMPAGGGNATDAGFAVDRLTGKVVFRGSALTQAIYSANHGATWSAPVNVGGATVYVRCSKNALLWTGRHFWDFARGRRTTTGEVWEDAAAPGFSAPADVRGYHCAPGAVIYGLSNYAVSGGSRVEVARLGFKRETFKLIPPADHLSRLPSRYYVRAR